MNAPEKEGRGWPFALVALLLIVAGYLALPWFHQENAKSREGEEGVYSETSNFKNPFTGEVDRVWAEAVTLEGCPNLHKVSEVLYRGAQPDDKGFAELKKLGIKTVVNLRSFHSDRSETIENDLNYLHLTVKAWHPERKELLAFLKTVTNKDRQPVFVHCQHGADRTGLMCALYRVAVQGWSKEEALEELRQGGFGFHEIWQNILTYFEKLDVEALKKDAGLH